MSEEKKNPEVDIDEQAQQPFDPAEMNDPDPLALDEQDDELEKLIAERDELRDRLMRALAEAENIRKRGERDRRDAELYGGTKLARDMLSVYDNMKRALETVDDQQREVAKALIEGIELTMREMLSVLAKHKIERVAPEVGEKFDPNLHQAVFEAPVPGIDAGNIVQLMAEGFVIGDRLLRPAQVGVSSTPATKSETAKAPAPDAPEAEQQQ
ncbi:MAG: nucleotide exchange factor GrpE [Paracoccaceae bacterium]|nr:nucleotide exchange factor GrpE [Paracoccaceae bacterium]